MRLSSVYFEPFVAIRRKLPNLLNQSGQLDGI